MALAETAKLVVALSLDDKRFTSGLGRASQSLSRFGSGVGQMGKGIGQVGAGLLRVGTIAATGFATGIGAAVKVAGDFQSQLNTINTIALVKNPEQLTAIGEGLRKTFLATGQPLADLTQAYYDLLSAGIKVEDAQSELNVAVKLGIGGLGTTTEAIDLLTTAQNSYGLTATETAKAADIFAKAVEDGKVTVAGIAASFADVAPLAKQAGVSLEELGAGYGFLTAKGVPAEEVTTQMNRAIIELTKPTGDLLKLQKKLGVSFADLVKQKGLVNTLQQIRVEADKAGVNFGNLFTRIEGRKFALFTTGENFKDFSTELAKFGDVSGTVEEQFAARAQGFNFELGRLKAGLQDAGITIGTALLPKLTPLLLKLNDFLSNNQGKIAAFGQKLADGFGSFADKIGKTDFTGIIDALRIMGDVGKKVVDVFLSLPSGVQTALITGLAVNKLSGGLIGQGAGNLAGGLLKIVFARGTTPANPLFVANVGGLPGGGAAGAPVVGGVLGVIKSFLGLTTAAGLGAIIGSEIGHNIFFDPAVAPAVKYEQSQFEKLLASGDTARMEHGLDIIEEKLTFLGADNVLARFLYGEQLDVLESQRDELRQRLPQLVLAQLGMTAKTAEIQAAIHTEAARTLDTLRGQANSLIRIQEKKFDPTVNVNVSATANISVSNVARTLTSFRIAGSSSIGGFTESAF